MVNLIFDIILIALLVSAIFFAYRLNNRLKGLRQLGDDLSPFMKGVAGYISQFSHVIDKLKSVSETSTQSLNSTLPQATILKDDFDILLEYGERMANKLDEVIKKARDVDTQLQNTLHQVETAVADHRLKDKNFTQLSVSVGNSADIGVLNAETMALSGVQNRSNAVKYKDIEQKELQKNENKQEKNPYKPYVPPIKNAQTVDSLSVSMQNILSQHAALQNALGTSFAEQLDASSEKEYPVTTQTIKETLIPLSTKENNLDENVQLQMNTLKDFAQPSQRISALQPTQVNRKHVASQGIMAKLRGLR